MSVIIQSTGLVPSDGYEITIRVDGVDTVYEFDSAQTGVEPGHVPIFVGVSGDSYADVVVGAIADAVNGKQGSLGTSQVVAKSIALDKIEITRNTATEISCSNIDTNFFVFTVGAEVNTPIPAPTAQTESRMGTQPASRTKRTLLKSQLLTTADADMRDLLKQLAAGHERAIEIQDNRGGNVSIHYDRDTNTLKVSADGKTWKGLGG
jgi:hypothetical protein